jgi:hypothetical protein
MRGSAPTRTGEHFRTAPKWREVNFAGQVPGWTRFTPAEEWLRGATIADKRIGTIGSSSGDRDTLVGEFLHWETNVVGHRGYQPQGRT